MEEYFQECSRNFVIISENISIEIVPEELKIFLGIFTGTMDILKPIAKSLREEYFQEYPRNFVINIRKDIH